MSQPADLLVKSVRVVSPTTVYQADVAVKDGRFVTPDGEARTVVDGRHLHLFPGVIDTQVHFREPGLTHKEDLESGTRAAVMGGVTTVLEMPNTNPSTTTPEALENKVKAATGRAWCDFGFFFGASRDNLADLARYERLPGSPGVKMFMGSSTGSLLVDDEASAISVLSHGTRPVAVHSEDEQRLRQRNVTVAATSVRDHPKVRDSETARLSTERLIRLCEETGRAIHILHVSTADEIPLIRDAKRRGLPMTCEITPQHLVFSEADYGRLGTRLQMNPPVRSEAHRDALWYALGTGLFDVFGSDHAPHTLGEKARPYPESPSGMPGVQTLFPVLLDLALTGGFSLQTLVRMTSQAPAQLYGLAAKGMVAPGYDADFSLVDLAATWTVDARDLGSKCGWSPFEGRVLQGRVKQVFLRGQMVFDGGMQGSPVGRPAEYTWK